MKSCGKSRNHLNHILLDHECQYRILQQSIKLLLGNSEYTKVVDWLIEQEIDHMASITKKHQMTKSYQVYICLIYKSKYLTALNIKHCQLEVSIPVRCRPISWDKLHLVLLITNRKRLVFIMLHFIQQTWQHAKQLQSQFPSKIGCIFLGSDHFIATIKH